MKIISIFLFCAAALGGSVCFANDPVVIDDRALVRDLGSKIGKLVDDGKVTSSVDLSKQLKRLKVSLETPKAKTNPTDDLYSDAVDSVGIIASVYKCGHCDDWHRSGLATCWILTDDGVMVTNYHVFHGKNHAGFGVLTKDGKVSPVIEILASDKKSDIAIFRVKGESFKPLSLGDSQKVGGDVHIIAHPDSRFFSYTSGRVSRYYSAHNRKATWMAVTAEFARGSSGGPVMDEMGNVVGMVSNTQSIYYPAKKKTDARGPFQMVVRNCVPVSAIRKLIESK